VRLAALAVVVLFFGACQGKSAAPQATAPTPAPVSLDKRDEQPVRRAPTTQPSKLKGVAADVFLESALTDEKAARAALAAGQAPDADCASALSYVRDLAGETDADVVAQLAEITRFCTYDAPLASAGKALDQIAAARKVNKDDPTIEACVKAQMAVETLLKAAATDAIRTLDAAVKNACP
jgi:hypothetical protein